MSLEDRATRQSKPFVEVFEGPPPDVMPGDRLERDDGWWRVVSVSIQWVGESIDSYRSEIEWRPMLTPRVTKALAA